MANKVGKPKQTQLKEGRVIVKTVIPKSNKFLRDLADVLTEQPYLTVRELSKMFCCSEIKINEGMRYITDDKCSAVHEKLDLFARQLIADICELLAINSTLTNKELAIRLGVDERMIVRSRKLVTDDDMLFAQQALINNYGTGELQCIKDFKPTIAMYTDKNGRTWFDVSEFCGITEYGGRCYAGQHFRIPGPEKPKFALSTTITTTMQ